ncbi:MAG: 4-hydroxythreonine-4-phosphate dehydrogenase PdxA [bacterium]
MDKNNIIGMTAIGITMGDPGGVGPEIAILSCKYFIEKKNGNIKPLIFGSSEYIDFVNTSVIKSKLQVNSISPEIIHNENDIARLYKNDCINVIDCSDETYKAVRFGVENSDYAKDTEKFILTAVEFAKSGKIKGVATAPINKDMMIKGGAMFPAHTELLAYLTSAENYAMLFYSKKLITVLSTIHIPLKSVSDRITKNSLEKIINISCSSLRIDFGINNPHIAVLGLNPHAGENGEIGNEEINIIKPVIAKFKRNNFNIEGPFPSDSFYAKRYKDFDIVVSMYHDQALIPFKLLSFNYGVNVTVGLPIVRTSPVHGTAYDIAGKNIADEKSMIYSIMLASKIANNRLKWKEK